MDYCILFIYFLKNNKPSVNVSSTLSNKVMSANWIVSVKSRFNSSFNEPVYNVFANCGGPSSSGRLIMITVKLSSAFGKLAFSTSSSDIFPLISSSVRPLSANSIEVESSSTVSVKKSLFPRKLVTIKSYQKTSNEILYCLFTSNQLKHIIIIKHVWW